jgi:hypothetical protein
MSILTPFIIFSISNASSSAISVLLPSEKTFNILPVLVGERYALPLPASIFMVFPSAVSGIAPPDCAKNFSQL